MGKNLRKIYPAILSIMFSCSVMAEPNTKFSFQSGQEDPVVFYHHQLGAGVLNIQATKHGKDPELNVPGSILPSLQSFNAKGVTLSLNDLTVPVLQYSYWFHSNWSIDTFIAVPPIVEVSGGGKLSAPINVINASAVPILSSLPGLGQVGTNLDLVDFDHDNVNPAATARAWTPGLLVSYHFGDTRSLIRPFIGMGPIYGFFTEEKLNPALLRKLNEKAILIAAATLNPNATALTDKTTAEPFLSIMGSAGFDINFTPRLGLKLLAAYIPAKTEIRVQLYDKKKKKVAELVNDVPLDPILLHASIFYKFNM